MIAVARYVLDQGQFPEGDDLIGADLFQVGIIFLRVEVDDLTTGEVELEGDIDEQAQPLANASLERRRNEQEEKAAPPAPVSLPPIAPAETASS